MKLSSVLLPLAAVCTASLLGATALQGTQQPEKPTATPKATQQPEKPTATPASMPKIQPTREHAMLQKLVGTWDATMTMSKPGEPPSTSKLTVVYKPVGELWVASEMSGQMMGAPFTSNGFDGYDTQKKKLVSVWVDSLSTDVNRFEGTYDEATKTTTLTGECRDMESGKLLPHRVVSEMKDDDTTTCRVYVRGADGKETEVAKVESKRRK